MSNNKSDNKKSTSPPVYNTCHAMVQHQCTEYVIQWYRSTSVVHVMQRYITSVYVMQRYIASVQYMSLQQYITSVMQSVHVL